MFALSWPLTNNGSKFVEFFILPSIFCFFSMTALLVRLGSTLLSQYPGSYLQGVVWANFVACVIMGFCSSTDRPWKLFFRRGVTDKKQLTLFVGLTTGFCGSCSSFSTLIAELFLYTANINSTGYYDFPNRAYGLLQFMSVLVTQFAMSYAGLLFGTHIANLVERDIFFREGNTLENFIHKQEKDELVAHQKSIFHKIYNLIELILSLFGVASFIIVLVLTIVKPDWRYWTFSLLFAPFACYLRYYLAKRFNGNKNFWLNKVLHIKFSGTLLANVIASTITPITIILLRGKKALFYDSDLPSSLMITSVLKCQVLSAIDVGFAGILSTTSTFMLELHTNRFKVSAWYFIISISICFVLNLVIIGPFSWKRGLELKSAC